MYLKFVANCIIEKPIIWQHAADIPVTDAMLIAAILEATTALLKIRPLISPCKYIYIINHQFLLLFFLLTIIKRGKNVLCSWLQILKKDTCALHHHHRHLIYTALLESIQ